MEARTEREHEDRGLSARHLVLVFLAGVAVCAVFFSLGFLVGYNERSSGRGLVTEQVTSPAVVPPTVNPPPETVRPAVKGPTAAVTSSRAPGSEHISGKPAEEAKASPQRGAATSGATPGQAASSSGGSRTGSQPGAGPTGKAEVSPGFTVQVAAAHAKEDAEALVKILKARGYPVFLVTPEYAHAKDNLYRVQVGPFRAREDAEKVRDKLAQEGFKKPFVKQ